MPADAIEIAVFHNDEIGIFNGRYTIESPTGEYRTFQIRTQPDDAKFAPGKRTISLLNGPDNTQSYIGFGWVVGRDIRVWHKKLGTRFEKFALMLMALILHGDESALWTKGYRLHGEGRCCRCNRVLTVPESVKTGIGPVCAGKT